MIKEDNIFEINSDIIKERYPEYIEYLSDYTHDEEIYAIKDTKENYKTLRIKKENKNLYLHSRYYPSKEASIWIDKKDSESASIHIFFGLGLGYYLLKYISKLQKGHKVIVYEPDCNIFNIAIRNVDFKNILENENIKVIVGKYSQIRDYINAKIQINTIIGIGMNVMPNYTLIYQDEIKKVLKSLQDIIVGKIVNKNTMQYFSKIWNENLILNTKHFFQSHTLSEYINIYKDKPLIIVSAGPSLSKNILELKNAKGNAIIVCVGRALKLLLQEGIYPDFIANVEGSDITYKQFEGLKYQKIPLIYTSVSAPKILNNHEATKILVPLSDPYIYKIFSDMGINACDLDCGGSVANMAFSFAKLVGADPIVFVGQDLAYTDGETHAKGLLYGTNDDVVIGEGQGQGLKTVTGIDGKELFTSVDFYLFLRWFEQQILYDKSGTTYINATEGGANIEGTKILTLKETIEKYCDNTVDIDNIIDSINKNHKKISKEKMESFIKDLENVLIEIMKIMDLCNKGITNSDDLYYKYKFNINKDVNKILRSLDTIDREIKQKKDNFYILSNVLQPIFFKSNEIKRPVKFESDRERSLYATELGKEFYEEVSKVIKETRPLIVNLINELKENLYSNSEVRYEI